MECFFDEEELLWLQVLDAPKDGSCLFHCMSYFVYGTMALTQEVRHEIVSAIVADWDQYQVSLLYIFGYGYWSYAMLRLCDTCTGHYVYIFFKF